MPLYQVNAGDRILAADANQYFQILKGVAASGETITLIYNAAASVIVQPSSDPAAGTEAVQVKNNAGTVQSALSFDGRLYPADGLVGTPGVAFELDKDTGFWRVAANTMAGVAGGVERYRVDATGFSIDAATDYINTLWTDFTPTVTQNGARTITIAYCRYKLIGKTVVTQGKITITNAGTAGFGIQLASWPAALAPKQSVASSTCGVFQYNRAGTYYQGLAEFAASTTIINLIRGGNADTGTMGSAAGGNFATANGDILSFQLVYELA